MIEFARQVRSLAILSALLGVTLATSTGPAWAQSPAAAGQQESQPQQTQPATAPSASAQSQTPPPTAPQQTGAQACPAAPSGSGGQAHPGESGQPAPPSPCPPQAPTGAQNPGLTDKQQKNAQSEAKTGFSKDRLFFALPNFLTVEDTDHLPPLTAGQKFKGQARSIFDPAEFLLAAASSGIGQARNSNPSYGQGMSGYGLRYATAFGDNVIENFMSSAVLPSLLHQDPRYYQLGNGGFLRRTRHAIGRLVLTRSDSGKTQFNFSEVFGAGIAASISTYTYHPEQERDASTVISTWGTQMGIDMGTYILKEFWPDLRKKFKKGGQAPAAADATTSPAPATASPRPVAPPPPPAQTAPPANSPSP